MLELEFDDAVWRDAIGAIRGDGTGALARTRPELAELVEDLAREAAETPILVGARLGTPGKNGRLLAFLVAGLLARGGTRTLFLDLSADLRWLEHLVGEDLKEGLIDHLRYGVPIERCVRRTPLEGLSVLSGGAYFLAGSPLEDAPGLRAALEGLRGSHPVVVVVFPQPAEAADAAGLASRCDAILTVREGDAGIPLAGNERALVRLTGDPQAARDLVRLTDQFLGPLPAVLARAAPGPARQAAAGSLTADAVGGPAPIGRPVRRTTPFAPPAPAPVGRPELASRPPLDDVDFLRAFEDDRPAARPDRPVPRPAAAPEGRIEEADLPASESESRPGLRALIVGAAILVGALLALALATDLFDPLFAGDGGGSAVESPAEEPGTMVPLDPAAGDGGAGPAALEAGAPLDSVAADPADAAARVPGEPAPWSVHVGSYQTVESGQRLVDRIRAAGELAFLAPVDLPGKGRWNRVYAGAYADSADARSALQRLLDDEVVEEGAVRSTPWAFLAGADPTRSDAEARRDALGRRGIPAYVVGAGPARVYVGAYRDADEAAPMGRMIEGTAEVVLDLRRK